MNLTQEQINNLRSQHKKERNAKVRDRIKAILLVNSGYSYEETAKILLLDDSTIRRHIDEYRLEQKISNNNHGYDGKLSKIECTELIEHVKLNTYADVKAIIKYVAHKYNIQFSRSGMNAWLKHYGFRYKRPHQVPAKYSEIKQDAFIAEITPIINRGAIIYSLDASHPAHQSKATHGWIFIGEHKALKTTATQRRVHLFGALNMHTKEVSVIEANTINSQAVISLIETIKTKHQPNELIHFILDNAKYQKSFLIKDYLQHNPNIIFHYLPPYSPNLNLIERVWKFMHKKITNNQYYEHYADFRRAIIDFFGSIPQYMDELRSLLTFKFQKLNYPIGNFAK